MAAADQIMPTAAARKSTYRESDSARRIMSRVHARPRAQRSRAFDIRACRKVLARFGYRSVWNGEEGDLTVVRIDRTEVLDLANAMVLQVREANCKVPEDVIERAKKVVRDAEIDDVVGGLGWANGGNGTSD